MLQKHDIFIDNTPNGVTKCNQKICGTCDYILETDTLHFHNAETLVGTFLKIMRPLSCLSKNVIYKIICRGCQVNFYIGQTVHVRNRMTGHRFDLRHVDEKICNQEYIMKVHMHLRNCATGLKPPFYFVPFYQVNRKTLTARLTVENYFIRKYSPTLNS